MLRMKDIKEVYVCLEWKTLKKYKCDWNEKHKRSKSVIRMKDMKEVKVRLEWKTLKKYMYV